MRSFLSRTGIPGLSHGVADRCGVKLVLMLMLVPDVCLAGAPIPGEQQAGIIYALTHLHPITYMILFAIFVLSVVNLVYRGWLKTSHWPLSTANGLNGRVSGRIRRKGKKKQGKGRGSDGMTGTGRTTGVAGETWQAMGDEALREGVLNAPRTVKKADEAVSSQPTPLDGVNHPLPESLVRSNTEPGAPRMLSGQPELPGSKPQFKFTSAVELPSQEEIERRDKQKLVVNGIVKGPDGKGFGSVLVYLTDERGNRIGQSCRSVVDTGEFKVLVNEPGKYLLVGYKRGYIMEDPEAARLPIESGKIEGFTLRMIAEGCLVHGRVLFEEYGQPEPGLEVRCVRLEDGFTRSATVESAGTFRITGVPQESTCHLEVLSGEEEVLATSETFQTGREREVFRNITIPTIQIVEAFGESTTAAEEPLEGEPAGEDSAHSTAVPEPAPAPVDPV